VSWLLILIYVLLPIQAEEAQAPAPPAFVLATHIEFSYVQTSGNTKNRTFAGKLELAGTGLTNSFSFRSSGIYGRTDGTETSNRIMVDGRWERRFSERAFFFINATFISNKFAGYNYRLFGGPGLGVVLLDSPDQTLRSLLSLNYSRDKYRSGGLGSKNYGNIELLLEYQRKLSGSVKLKNSTDYLTSLGALLHQQRHSGRSQRGRERVTWGQLFDSLAGNAAVGGP
jgi:putative salt-induced outer membrane protein YdiY